MFHDIEQNTDEWLALRAGKVTGSGVAKIMANYGKAFGEPAQSYAVQIALEQIKNEPIRSSYSNAHMERGHEEEPLARLAYEAENLSEVKNGGFFDNGFTGCSPDGLIGQNGVIEIKSVIASVQYKRFKTGKFDSAYKWQLIFNLKETGREWIDYTSFCAEFPEDRKLFIQRLYAEEFKEEFKMIDSRLEEFRELVATVTANITKEAA